MRDDEIQLKAAVATPLSQDHEPSKIHAPRRDVQSPRADNNGSSPPRAKSTKSTSSLSELDTTRDDDPVTTTEFEVSFDDVKIGLSLEVVYANVVRVKDTSGPARACGCIQTGDVLVRVQGRAIAHDRFAHVMHTLKSAPRPLQLHFRRPVPTVELPPNFALNREPDNARRHNDVDSVCACHEEEDQDDDEDSNVDTAQDDSCSSSFPGSSTSSTACHGKGALTRPALNEAGSPLRHNPHPDNDLDTRTRPSSLAAQWKAITDWSFGLTKTPPPSTSLAPPLDDFETAMLSLRIEPPIASLPPTTYVLPTPSEDGAALLVRWQPCVGAKTYHLQQSRDWPVKIWKQCTTTTIQSGGPSDEETATTDMPPETDLLECVVNGLDYNRSYVFRVRCALESGACGDFSDASDAITTTAAPLSAQSPLRPCDAATLRSAPSPPADVALAYHPDFEGDANALSLVVTWTAVPRATTYQVQWMRNGQRLVWRNSPDLSAWEVAKDAGFASGTCDALATTCQTAMQYTLQGLASGTEYVVRIRAGTEGPTPTLVWGEFSAWSSPLATIASEDDLAHAQDALARKEAAAAVVEHIKSMATSVKDAVGGTRNPGLFAQVRQLYKS